MEVYVDTGAWIALHDRKDKLHDEAKKTLSRLARDRHLLVTGRHTLVEFADGLARHFNQATAAREVSRICQSPRVRVAESEPYWATALDLLAARTDWNVDLSDCLSFAMMQELGILQAFTFDSDFEKAGFKPVH